MVELYIPVERPPEVQQYYLRRYRELSVKITFARIELIPDIIQNNEL